MVTVNLDEIIHYRPPARCSHAGPLQPNISVSVSPYPPSLKPPFPLTHPLPPRPFPPASHPKSPSLAVACLPSHPLDEASTFSFPTPCLDPRKETAQPNEFDRILADLGRAESESQEQDDRAGDVGRKELKVPCDGENILEDEAHGDIFCVLPNCPLQGAENMTPPEILKYHPSTLEAVSVPTILARNPAKSEEPRSSSNLAMDDIWNQDLAVSYGKLGDIAMPEVVNTVPTSDDGHYTQSTSSDTTAPTAAAQADGFEASHLPTLSAKACAVPSSPATVQIEYNSSPVPSGYVEDILNSRDETPSGVRSFPWPHQPKCDVESSHVVSPTSRQRETHSPSESDEESPQNDLPVPCSVSVVVPALHSVSPKAKRASRNQLKDHTRKRKNRTEVPCSVLSYDSDDSDFQGGGGGPDDIIVLRPTKKYRRGAAPGLASAQLPHEARDEAQLGKITHPIDLTGLHDIETIPIRGYLTRQVFLSEVVYSCTFHEERDRSSPHSTRHPINSDHQCQSRISKVPSLDRPTSPSTAGRSRFLPEEDDLLIDLKERRNLPWGRIVNHFPGRTKNSLQVRYSTRLKDRNLGVRDRKGSRPIVGVSQSPSATCDLDTRPQPANHRYGYLGSSASGRYGPPRARRPVNRYSPA